MARYVGKHLKKRTEKEIDRNFHISAVCGMMVIALTLIGCDAYNHNDAPAEQEPQTVEICEAFEQAPVTAKVLTVPTVTDIEEPAVEEEAPDEVQRSYEALLAKCQKVENCAIVGYAPELIEGWRSEWRNENGLYLTASGVWCAPYCTVATDPDIIPTGATVIFDGNIYVAADKGVKGKVVDVMVSVEDALTYGVHYTDVWWCMEGDNNE